MINEKLYEIVALMFTVFVVAISFLVSTINIFNNVFILEKILKLGMIMVGVGICIMMYDITRLQLILLGFIKNNEKTLTKKTRIY